MAALSPHKQFEADLAAYPDVVWNGDGDKSMLAAMLWANLMKENILTHDADWLIGALRSKPGSLAQNRGATPEWCVSATMRKFGTSTEQATRLEGLVTEFLDDLRTEDSALSNLGEQMERVGRFISDLATYMKARTPPKVEGRGPKRPRC